MSNPLSPATVRAQASRAAAWVSSRYTPSGFLFGAVALLGFVLIVTSFIQAHYLSLDPVSSLTLRAGANIGCDAAVEALGNHCLGDYTVVRTFALSDNPWNEHLGYTSNYPAAGLLPHWFFGEIGVITGNAAVGAVGYFIVLALAVLAPAWWASQGKPLTTRILTLGMFGLVSVPVLMTLDRGNSTGFLAASLLALLVGVRRGDDRLAMIGLVASAMVRPQMLLLVLVFVVWRKWKFSLIAAAWIAVTNLVPYALWPQDFPRTLLQTVTNTLDFDKSVSMGVNYPSNLSFAKLAHEGEQAVRDVLGYEVLDTWVDAHQSVPGIVVLLVVAAAIVALGRRLPAVVSLMALSMVLALFSSVTWSYYLIFALPIAALLLRDPLERDPRTPGWRGLFDRDQPRFDLRTVAVALLVFATAMSVSRVLTFSQIWLANKPSEYVFTSAGVLPLLWLIAFAALFASWARRPVGPYVEAAVDR